MKTKLHTTTYAGLALISALSFQFSGFSQGTAFTYQGRLNDGTQPADGNYDLRFAIYDAASDGAQQGDSLTNAATAVRNGLFTVTLDFGAEIFTGADRWLEIGVRTNGGGAFRTLAPRQSVWATPYAIRAREAATATAATTATTVVTGGVSTGSLQDNAVTSVKIADGSITAADVSSTSFSNTFWKVDGNPGTLAGTHFLGTLDNTPLEFKVNGQRALRIEYATNVNFGYSPNFVGGFPGNMVSNGFAGAVIGGGGTSNSPNRVGADYATVVGGRGNTASGYSSTALGNGVIASGGYSTAMGVNTTASSNYSTAMGIGTTASGSSSTAMGNNTTASGTYSTAMGANTAASGRYSTAMGVNTTASSNYSTAMGIGTTASGSSSTAMGNGTTASGADSTAMGANTTATGRYSTAIGYLANAIHPGTFVWADSTDANFDSTSSNQFLIRASGGVGINKDNPATALDVNGTVTASNFSGNGGSLTNLNAWGLGGNAGTTPGTQFIGTTDNQPLEFKVNGQRALRFIPSTSNTGGTGPNLVAGGPGNTLAGAIGGAAVSGGWGQFIDLGADGAIIGGGNSNRIGNNAKFSVIAGGQQNELGLGSLYSTIAGGRMNRMGVGVYDAVIAGGAQNTITASYGQLTIGGGYGNSITGQVAVATVSGGAYNVASADGATVAGGTENYAGGGNSFAAGYRSRATGHYSFAMGSNALASGFASTALGLSTIASGNYSTALGWFTTASGEGSTTMGLATVASDYFSTAMGLETTANGWTSTAMGAYTVAKGSFSIAMGYSNNASGHASTAMGNQTTASGSYATAMGSQTIASGNASTAMGFNSRATNEYAFAGGLNSLAGGWASTAMGRNATAGGSGSSAIGEFTTASGDNSTALGSSTAASGLRSTAMGWSTVASGEYSTAMGKLSQALHNNTFVWSDGSTPAFGSSATNQFLVQAIGGVGIGTANPQAPLHVGGRVIVNGADQWDVNNNEGDFRVGSSTHRFKIGVAQGGGGAGDVWMRAQGGTARLFLKTPGGTTIYSNEGQSMGVTLAAGGGSWSSVSDRNAKENFEPVDPQAVLEKVAALPVSTWNYKAQEAGIRHLGPMAQDFKAAFGLGETDTGITSVDADGVALAAIQGLNQKLEQRETEITELQQKNQSLEERLEALEQIILNQKSN